MAINFPKNPTDGDIFTDGNSKSWVWDSAGESWNPVSGSSQEVIQLVENLEQKDSAADAQHDLILDSLKQSIGISEQESIYTALGNSTNVSISDDIQELFDEIDLLKQNSNLSTYATVVGYNPSDETDSSSIVLNAGDAVNPAEYHGDIIGDSSGELILDISNKTLDVDRVWSFDGEVVTKNLVTETIGYDKANPSDPSSIVLTVGDLSTPAEFTGNVTGDVTGNVTGDVTGNLTGDVTDGVSKLTFDSAHDAIISSSLLVQGGITIESGARESFETISNTPNSVVNHDCDNGHIFYHDSPQGDWIVNILNLNLENNSATTITCVVQQGQTARLPGEIRISPSTLSETITWQGGTPPTGTVSGVDVVSFSILRKSDGSYLVLGQLVDFS